MSPPSKRFVLPYEPEYTAHRTDCRVGRAVQLHSWTRRRMAGPALAPQDADNEPAFGGTLRRKAGQSVELEPDESFPPRR
jgi:hypothetical protein